MKVIILGGDGFCGWPTSLHLSNLNFEVIIVDNLSRRNIDNELEVSSLTPIAPIGQRLSTWKNITGKEIKYYNLDIAEEYDRLLSLISSEKPDAIVHFAEQRAAPYSMKSSKHKRYTVNNNLNATNNLFDIALADPAPVAGTFAETVLAGWRANLITELGADATGAVDCNGPLCQITIQWDDSRGTDGSSTMSVQTAVQL